MATCRCGARWTGHSACHCAAPGCHRTFSGIELFDRHRTPDGEHGSCRDPATILKRSGELLMVLRGGVWSYPPMPAEEVARHEAARARR